MDTTGQLLCASAPTLASLRDSLALHFRTRTESWLVSDVSIGSWRGHQVATELCGQLGVPSPRRSWPSLTDPGPTPSFADLVGHGIDAESRGDTAALAALDAAQRITIRLSSMDRRTIVIFAPRTGIAWEHE